MKEHGKKIIIGSLLFSIIGVAYLLYFISKKNLGIKTLPDGTQYIIHPDKFLSGGPEKGGIGIDQGIPALDAPQFISAQETNLWLSDEDIIFGINIDGIQKAYPKQIMVWHEVINDWINNKPLLVTYCPLCGTGIAFKRTINQEPIRFGVSGKLYNSNLVMYDESTESLWPQVLGQAVVGPLSGTKLTFVPIQTMQWKDWKRIHPSTVVLSKNTGIKREYGKDPYERSYYRSGNPGFGINFTDNRLKPKTMVTGVCIEKTCKAYPVIDVDKINIINDNIENIALLVLKDPSIDINEGFEVNPIVVFDRTIDKKTLTFSLYNNMLVDQETNTLWNFTGKAVKGTLSGKQLKTIPSESSMWFAWLAFHPNTQLFVSS